MFAGILLSVMASCVFGVLSYYSVLLLPLNGFGIVAWRVVFTTGMLLLVMSLGRFWPLFIAQFRSLLQQKHGLLMAIGGTALLSVQLALFGWAPINGEGQALAMGYFLLPLTLVLTGRVIYGERLTPMRRAAVACASVGVLAGLVTTGGFSLVSLIVMLGYPPYFLLRKRLPLNALNGVFTENVLLVPVAILILFYQSFNPAFFAQHQQGAWLLLCGLGIVSATALLCYMGASRKLPMVLFGLLGYVEPLLLFVVALLIGETMTVQHLWTYIPIWLAVLCLVAEGVRKLLRQQRSG